jgi:hypothetical protein
VHIIETLGGRVITQKRVTFYGAITVRLGIWNPDRATGEQAWCMFIRQRKAPDSLETSVSVNSCTRCQKPRRLSRDQPLPWKLINLTRRKYRCVNSLTVIVLHVIVKRSGDCVLAVATSRVSWATGIRFLSCADFSLFRPPQAVTPDSRGVHIVVIFNVGEVGVT